MGFWFFGRKKEEENINIKRLQDSLSSSFSHVKSDIEQIGVWINHFQEKHDKHDTKFNHILKRVNIIEEQIAEIQDSITREEPISQKEVVTEEPEEVPIAPKQDLWESLTEGQQRICTVLAAIHKEFPDQWITLKYLAEELYPDKDYNKVRSTVSQYITNLEELGLVKRRRRGKQTYLYSTANNPCIKRPILLKQAAKRLRKKI